MLILKKEIIDLLEKKRFDELSRLSCTPQKLFSILISLSYDKTLTISWRAIEAIGLIAREMSKAEPDLVRNLVGRLLWMIRDESGGIGWSAPEMLGEIVRNNPVLCSDTATIIVSFHDENMLTAGVLRAIGRIGNIHKEFVEFAMPVVRSYLHDAAPLLRGLAAWALGEIGAKWSVDDIQQLTGDKSIISFYEDGDLKNLTVGEIAKRSREKLFRQ
ncbi:MAG: HEAT repeat domain-containing protein [Nitrospirae bacterium]|nr:HEAT repeat domain-containing protein [Nitrospirota bacterium]